MKITHMLALGILGSVSLFGAEEKKKETVQDQFLGLVVEKAKKYSDAAENGIGKAVDLVKAEAPELLQEFMRWRMFKHAFATLMLIPLAISMYYGWRFAFKFNDDSAGFGTLIMGCYSMGSCVVLVFWMLPNMMGFFQILIAPRIYIIEQAAALLK